MRLRAATPDDAAAISAIYRPYVTDSAVSFETQPPDAAAIRARMMEGWGRYPWFVAETEDGRLMGYAYATAFRTRPAYRFAVETSVYLSPEAQGQGLGSELYDRLLRTLEAQGYAQAIAAITLPNPASVQLHERKRFAAAGVYRQIGHKHGRWHDVGLWQRALAAPADPPVEPTPLPELL